jgi:hypothetical protein
MSYNAYASSDINGGAVVQLKPIQLNPPEVSRQWSYYEPQQPTYPTQYTYAPPAQYEYAQPAQFECAPPAQFEYAHAVHTAAVALPKQCRIKAFFKKFKLGWLLSSSCLFGQTECECICDACLCC